MQISVTKLKIKLTSFVTSPIIFFIIFLSEIYFKQLLHSEGLLFLSRFIKLIGSYFFHYIRFEPFSNVKMMNNIDRLSVLIFNLKMFKLFIYYNSY